MMLHGAEVEVRLHVYRVEVGGAGDQDRANYNSFDLICQMTGQQSVWTDIERK